MAYPYQPGYYHSIGYQRPEYAPQQMQIMPQQTIQTPPALQPQAGFICRAVTSREEAAVAQIPLDGSVSYFVDTGNGKIYAKAFRPDGTAPLVTYTREDEPVQITPQYVTFDQFAALETKLNRLEQAYKREESTQHEPVNY